MNTPVYELLFRVRRRKLSGHLVNIFNMELIIYGTFLALSLLAYGARRAANKGDEKKISISNINFKRFLFLRNQSYT